MSVFERPILEKNENKNNFHRHQKEDVSVMKINLEKQKFKICDAKKTARGQYNTEKSTWLYPQVVKFIQESNPKFIIDPFAGKGDLLNHIQQLFPGFSVKGYDIDPKLGWEVNDSLIRIPPHQNALILTNPPYLANFSAKRKGVIDRVDKYYTRKYRSDLYQVAIDACLENFSKIVAIIPETVINSSYPLDNFVSISIINDLIFTDTEQPVVVACISRDWMKGPEIFQSDKFINSLSQINKLRDVPCKNIKITFNDPSGQVGLRAVDLPSPDKRIAFMPSNVLKYNKNDIKHSSRLVTCVSIDGLDSEKTFDLCEIANQKLEQIRKMTEDVILSPFKGNSKTGARRRRLDYSLARAILEKSFAELYNTKNFKKQMELF